MDGLAIAAALSELRSTVEGGAIRGVHEPDRGSIVILVFLQGERRILISPRNARIHETRAARPNPPSPSPFVMQLRKHLGGGRIRRIEQRGWDRVVSISVERGGAASREVELIAELVGPRGNLILVEGDRILGALRRDERCNIGSPYAPLLAQRKLDPDRVTAEEIAGLLESGDPARALVQRIDGIGRETAEDLLVEADGMPDRIVQALRTLIEYVESAASHVIVDEPRATFYPPPRDARPTVTFGEALDLAACSPAPADVGREDLRERIERALERRARTAQRLAAWLVEGEEERLRRSADLLMIHHAEVEAGAREATLSDPASGEVTRIPLDPKQSAIENAQRLYERAKRLRRGRPQVRSRLRQLQEEAAILREASARAESGRPPAEEALELLPGARPRTVERTTLARRFRIGGYTVLVGRNARENDRLLREARPDDVWMHARDAAGSHVIVRQQGGEEIPHGVLEQAARLAAWFSKARGEKRIDVSVAAAKHVRKPKGAPAGLAIVRDEDTLTVESEEPRGR